MVKLNKKTSQDIIFSSKKILKIKRNKKVITKRKPVGPKRSTSAYLYFVKEMTPKYKEEHPEIKMVDRSIEFGRMWRELSPSARKPYEDLAAIDRQRFLEAKATFGQQETTSTSTVAPSNEESSSSDSN